MSNRQIKYARVMMSLRAEHLFFIIIIESFTEHEQKMLFGHNRILM